MVFLILLISVLCVLGIVISDDNCTSLAFHGCESRRHHGRIHAHLGLHLHHWISRIHASICRHGLLILRVRHIVTDIDVNVLVLIFKSADFLDSIAVIIIVYLYIVHLIICVRSFKFLSLRLALATEEAAADTTASSSRAFRNNNHDNYQQDYHAHYYNWDYDCSIIHWAIVVSISVVSSHIDIIVIGVTVVIVSRTIVGGD